MSYTYKSLKIDLTRNTIEIIDTEKELIENFIGGKGMGFALMEKYAPNPDALSPENPLIFVNGPFTGTKVQTSARTALITKSPLTNSLLDSHCGGNFGPALKRAGFDYVFISGKAKNPVYLYITEDKQEIVEAGDLWGKGIFETNKQLIKQYKHNDPRIACIGPAGENLSKIACIGVDKHRQYGRGGAGAVMGSKNLKAIVADGKEKIEYFDDEKFKKINKELTKEILNDPGVKFRRKMGTMKCIRSGQKYKILPVKNWQEVTWDEYEKLSSETARKELNWKDTSCYGCHIHCSKWAKWDIHEVEGPEFETTAFLGTNSLVNNIKDVTWANEMCNDLGMDTISTGVICGFAMECHEKGLIEDWKGLKLNWGNAEQQRKFIELMAYKKGVGKIFADGTRDAAEKIGKGSKEFAINTYGMELSGVNPKGSLTMALVFAVADFASHTRCWVTEAEMGPEFKIEDIPPTVMEGIDTINARNSMIICDFVPLGLEKLSFLLNAATGSEWNEDKLLKLGARISNIARKYNIRNGRTHHDDTIPERFFKEKSLSGFMKDKAIDRKHFKSLVGKYYGLRGWNAEGTPV